MHFLIADHHIDSATVLGMLTQVHVPCSTVDVVHDGIAALKSATAKRPDVAILSLNMPLMNGPTVARSMRSFFPTNVTLLIGVSGDAGLLRSIESDGPFDHLFLKPCDIQRMMSLIQP